MSKNEIDLESLREVRDYFADRQDAEHRDGETFPTPNEEMRLLATVDSVIAELTARRARDAEVEALVKAAKDAARDIHLVLSIDGQELELGSLRKLSSAERNLRTTLSAFTGDKT